MGDERRKAPRKDIEAKIEFVVDAQEIMEARGVDLSETGIGFVSDEPLTVALTLNVEGRELLRRARLMRVEREDGAFVFGLEFIQD